MKYAAIWLSISLIAISSAQAQSGFEIRQRKFPRVSHTYKFRSAEILWKLKSAGLSKNNFRMLLMAAKENAELRIFAGENRPGAKLFLLESYRICAGSGIPGPKNCQGDGQVPEGFYHISRFNPESLYHLALEISYPGKADVIRSDCRNPGSAIMIHGKCVTIGCLPMTDSAIEEIYLYAVTAAGNGQQKIPVYLFPAWPDSREFSRLLKTHSENTSLIDFWQNLADGFRIFTANSLPLQVSVTPSGRYAFARNLQ